MAGIGKVKKEDKAEEDSIESLEREFGESTDKIRQLLAGKKDKNSISEEVKTKLRAEYSRAAQIARTLSQRVTDEDEVKKYEDFFKRMQEKYPQKLALRLGFLPDLAQKIYAGSDIFLMPSKSEPCGLSQMVALRYGSIPIVRETGGLKDSIFDSGNGEGNGFTFANYNAHDMLHTIYRALEGYSNQEGWQILVKRAMHCDYSWKSAAGEYIKMYKEVCGG